MDLAIIEMKVEGSVGFEDAPSLFEARFEEGPVIGEGIVIRGDRLFDEGVALSFEANPVSILGSLALERGAGLNLAGVEGRVDVDEIDALGGK